jgi:hypothetical protein
MNIPMYKYLESGYSKERADVYKNLIDLNATINLFNTSKDPDVKQDAIQRFITLNNQLETNTKKRLLP